MKYLKVKWIHSKPEEPVLLYSELDEAHWEIRKVEVFKSGMMDFAHSEESSGTTRLGVVPVPTISEIAGDPEFEPVEITKGEFERIWSKAHGN